jgi:pseudouridine kinase
MGVTEREQEIIDLLRREPLITPAAIAERLGSSRAAVNVHLSNLGRKGVILGRGYILSERPPVVVVGGANLDIKARSGASAIPGTSNPGRTTTTPGGVARNIAENLARLGTPTQLIAAVGRDPYGERLLADTRAAGVSLDHVHRCEHPTGSYTAVLDADGELLLAVADMTATDDLRPEHLQSARELIAHAALLVLDGNLPAPTTAHLLDLAGSADLRVILDPVSVPKAARLAPLLSPERPLFALTPNRDELRALTGEDAAGEDSDSALARTALRLHDRGVRHVWIRLGPSGSLLSTRGPGERAAAVHQLAADPAEVQDVTGAGDAMLAAFAYALLAGHPPLEAARHGHAAAALTLASTHTVRPDLTERLLAEALRHSPAVPAPSAQESSQAR